MPYLSLFSNIRLGCKDLPHLALLSIVRLGNKGLPRTNIPACLTSSSLTVTKLDYVSGKICRPSLIFEGKARRILRGEHLKEAPLGLVLTILTNISLARKGSQRSNTLAYLASTSLTA